MSKEQASEVNKKKFADDSRFNATTDKLNRCFISIEEVKEYKGKQYEWIKSLTKVKYVRPDWTLFPKR